jgi:hypothetical protein
MQRAASWVGEAVTEADALEPPQFALAVAAQRAGLGHGILLGPVGAQPLDRLGAVADEAAALQLEHGQRADELGLQRRAELTALAPNDVGDRERVAGVGLARPLAVALAVGAPGRHVQHLQPGGGQRPDELAAIAARRLDTDDRFCGVVLAEPPQQAAIALRTIGDGQRAEFAAALVDQPSGVGVLVNIDPDEHPEWPPGSGLKSRPGRRATLLCRCSNIGASSPIKSASPARPQPAGRRIERKSRDRWAGPGRGRPSTPTRLLPESDHRARGASPPNRTAPRR